MRVLRIYHEGRDPAHRERDRALVRAGAELLLIAPQSWPGADDVVDEQVRVIALPVSRAGDVNRHRYVDAAAIGELARRFRPDVVDLHEEPFSAVTHQLLRVLPRDQAVVAYTAQNIDKRFPPPFAQYERRALARLDGLYPCSAQAASVAVGKGFRGAVRVLPLAPAAAFRAGDQVAPTDRLRLLLVGRLVPEKGVLDAVRVLAAAGPAATLTLIGDGPEREPAQELARRLGVDAALHVEPWLGADDLAGYYREAHVVLVPSSATRTWVEQFGRVVVEAHAAGAVVVGYASGSLPEVVGGAGVLVAEGDVEALSGAVRRLRAEPQHWSELRAAGLAAAVTWDDVAAGQLALYAGALEAARVRQGIRRPPAARPDRDAADATYGPAARLPGAARPFALPVLRNGPPVAQLLGRAIDRTTAPRTRPPDRLRVVYLDHVARLSGGEIALARLLAALPHVDAHVILGEDGPLRAELESAGAQVEILPLDARARDTTRDAAVGVGGARSAAALAAYVTRLTRRLRHLQPDLVHANSLKSGFYGCTAARLARVPVVWHLRDRLAEDYLPSRAIAVTRRTLAQLPDAVLCPSQEIAAHLAAPATVIADPYAPTRRPGRADGPPQVIGVVGRISPWKGQDVVLRALAQLPGLRLRIIGAPMFGEDDYLRELHALTDRLGIGDRVEFSGFVPDVEAALAELDVLVHAATVAEPFGQVVVEGLAAGLPVIATDAGGPREILTDGVDGLLVAPGDPDALTAALHRLRTDDVLRHRLSGNAARRARAFEPDAIGVQVQAFYRAVLGQ